MALTKIFALILVLSFSSIYQGEEVTINKPKVVETIKEHGVIYDCIDIYEQPSLKHPSLMNHEIKLRPSKEVMEKLAKLQSKSSNSGVHRARFTLKKACPNGTIPIERKSPNRFPSTTINMPSKRPQLSQADSGHGIEFAGVYTANIGNRYYGAGAVINLYNPQVGPHQYSSAAVSIRTGPYRAEIGWIVNYDLNDDNRTRLYLKWDSLLHSGCFNDKCSPGFVQTNSKIPLNALIEPMSEIGGSQYVVPFSFVQDLESRNWYAFVGDHHFVEPLGYFPTYEVFPDLADGAEVLQWGGFVSSNQGDETTPQMGSGLFVDGSYTQTCFMIQAWYDGDVTQAPTRLLTNNSRCYRMGDQSNKTDYRKYSFVFGGAGGDDFNCT